ncbi:hypothetical protein M0534_01935 [Methylonatrum kenyense]|uniref:hypothetical protein n=1 Tax=Methylonatrum kenyense TaxID=455253 RepID=UPI0020BDE051|nr:hypothetical protein [Methylonatrum kenyense]MCK8515093.1 hypothetical protein [Methylonatrum kenyense]
MDDNDTLGDDAVHLVERALSRQAIERRKRTMQKRQLVGFGGLLLAGLLASQAASASDIDVQVLKPSGTMFVESFPANVAVELEIDARNSQGNCVNSNVQRIVVSATPLPDGDNLEIHNSGTGSAGLSGCPDSYTFDWTVAAPGSYGLLISLRSGSTTEAFDFEPFEFDLFEVIDVEYPAPPAVANAYFNQEYKGTNGRFRGCVISKIAEAHAKDSAYGPKGGPYDEEAIHGDVDTYVLSGQCRP